MSDTLDTIEEKRAAGLRAREATVPGQWPLNTLRQRREQGRFLDAGVIGGGGVGYLDAEELAEIRGDFADFLPSSATVYREREQNDDRGSKNKSYVQYATYACRFRYTSASVDNSEGRASPSKVAEIVIPYGADVRTKDRIQVGGTMFEVIRNSNSRPEDFLTQIIAVVVE